MSQSKPFFVGLATLILICLTSVLIIWQSDILRKMSGYELVGQFNDIGGLIKGADIRYRGYSVGRVVSIHPNPDNIEVRFWVNGKIQIPQGSTIKILFDGLVGENYIGIFANQQSKVMVKNGDVLSGGSGSDLAQFIDLGSQNLVHTEAILNALRTILKDENVLMNTAKSIENLEKITAKLVLFTSVLDEDTAKNFLLTLQNLEAITSSSRQISDELAKSDIILNVEKLTQELIKNSQALSGFMTEKNKQNFSETLEQINQLSERVNELLPDKTKERPHLLSTLAALSISNQTGVYASPALSTQYYNSQFEFGLGQYALIAGISNFHGDSSLEHFQQAYYINDKLRSRLGIIYKEAGLGIDYFVTKRFSIGAEYFNFSEGFYTLLTSYEFLPHLQFQTILRNNPTTKDSHLNLGLRYDF